MNDMSSILPIKQNSIFIYFASHCGSSEEKLKEQFKSTSLAYFVASLLYETTFLKQSMSQFVLVWSLGKSLKSNAPIKLQIIDMF